MRRPDGVTYVTSGPATPERIFYPINAPRPKLTCAGSRPTLAHGRTPAVATVEGSRRSDMTALAARLDAPSQGTYDRLLGFVRRRLRGPDAEDVVQDAYLRLTIASGRSVVRSPDAFLHTAALNLVRDRARAAAVRQASAGEAPAEPPCPAPGAEDGLAARQQLEVLESALAELPAKRRACLVLYRFDELSHAAIAERLGLSVSSVEKHIRRALDHCRRRLAEANGDA